MKTIIFINIITRKTEYALLQQPHETQKQSKIMG